MKVREIMNKNVISLRPDMSVREAAEILEKNNISGAPVVDENNRLLGIVTIKNIISLLKSRMENIGFYIASTPFDFMDFYQFNIPMERKKDIIEEISQIKVSEIMRRRVYKVGEDEDIYNAIDILVKKEISRVPVVDKDGTVVGIIARSDILKIMSKSNKIANEI